MANLTKENPGCYSTLLRYLSKKTGISLKYTIRLAESDLWFTNKSGKIKCKYNLKELKCFNEDGIWHHPKYSMNRLHKFGESLDSSRPLVEADQVKFDYYEIELRRNIADFGVNLNKCSKYRDSLGGGWYSDIDLFELDGLYFAPDMECSCC